MRGDFMALERRVPSWAHKGRSNIYALWPDNSKKA